jgi:hypothetical protein
MFAHLIGKARVKAGWFVALLYLFCVLAPGVALALGSAAPWLANDLKVATAASHDGSVHQHDHIHAAAHEPGAGGSHPHEHGGKASSGPCCAMLCLSTMAANLPSIAKPAQPKSVRVAESPTRLRDETPQRRYRPPIA